MTESFDNPKTLPTCDALVNCVSAADHMHPRIATHCISYAIGEKVVLRRAIKILPAYTPRRGVQGGGLNLVYGQSKLCRRNMAPQVNLDA